MHKRYTTRNPPPIVRIGHNPQLLQKYDRASTQLLLKLTANPLTPQLIGGIAHA